MINWYWWMNNSANVMWWVIGVALTVMFSAYNWLDNAG